MAAAKFAALVERQSTNNGQFQKICRDWMPDKFPYHDRIAAMRQLAQTFLTSTIVIEAHQTKFKAAFDAFMAKMHSHPRRVKPSEVEKSKVPLVLVLDARGDAFDSRGFWAYEAGFVFMWLVAFFADTPSELRDLSSLSDLPRPHVRWMYTRDQTPQDREMFAGLRSGMIHRLLAQGSPDRSLWWDKPLASDYDLLLMHCDELLIQMYEDHQSKAAIAARSRIATKASERAARLSPIDPRTGQLVATTEPLDVERDRTLVTLYVEVAFTVGRLPEEVVERAGAQLGGSAGEELLLHLFSIAVVMLNGGLLDPYRQSLAALSVVDDGIVLRAVAKAADNVRQALLIKGLQERSRWVLQRYARTRDLHQATSLYADVRNQLLVDGRARGAMRWAYARAKHVPFVQFLYDLDARLQTSELDRVAAWLRRPEVSERFRVRLGDVMYLESISDAERVGTAELRQAADDLRAHLTECDGRFAVMRFPSGTVRYHEVSTTFDLLCRRFPERMGARRPDGNVDAPERPWICSRAFLGADCQGPFIVAFREQLEIMRQLQLLCTLRSDRFHKNTPVFPLLGRLYYGRLRRRSGAVCDLEPAASPCGNPDDDVDEHALHVVVQVLAAWLGVEGDGLPDLGRPGFACFRTLHRFADQLRLAAEEARRPFPSDGDFAALADFLDMRRPRTLSRSLAEEVLRCQPRTASTLEEAMQRAGPGATRVPLADGKEGAAAALGNWLCLYAPIVNNLLPPELVSRVLQDSSPCRRTPPRVFYRGRCDVRTSTLEQLVEEYNTCFVVPTTHSQRALAPEFQHDPPHEPVEPLALLMGGLEARVSHETLGRAIATHMLGGRFDFMQVVEDRGAEQLIAAEHQRQQHKQQKLAGEAGEFDVTKLTVDGRSSLPVQIVERNDAKKLEVTFYESSFALVLLGGTEFARFADTAAAVEEAQIEEWDAPSRGSRMSAAFGRLIDLVIRFSAQLHLDAARARESRGRTHGDFLQMLANLTSKELAELADRQRRSIDDVRAMLDEISPPPAASAPAPDNEDDDVRCEPLLRFMISRFARGRPGKRPPAPPPIDVTIDDQYGSHLIPNTRRRKLRRSPSADRVLGVDRMREELEANASPIAGVMFCTQQYRRQK